MTDDYVYIENRITRKNLKIYVGVDKKEQMFFTITMNEYILIEKFVLFVFKRVLVSYTTAFSNEFTKNTKIYVRDKQKETIEIM